VADNVTVTSGSASYTAATDDCTTGQVPLVKLAYSADGNRTHVSADADGLLVNLGANNDVTVSDGGGSLTVDGTVAVVGPEAIDAAIGTNPIVAAGRASTAVPTAVSADNDAQALWVSRNGAANVIVRDSAGDSCMDDTNNALKVSIVSDSVGSTVDNEDGSVAAGQSSIALVIALPHSYDGSAWTRTAPSSYAALSTAAVLAAQVKGSAGVVYDLQCFNNGANEVFIRLYNQTGAPASTDTANIIWRGMVPGNAAGTGFTVSFPGGRVCGTGIGVRVSGAVADNDTTALSANEVMVNIGYK
jgi:hypothetical protein